MKPVVLLFVSVLGISCLGAEEVHQRLGVEKATDQEIKVGLDTSLAFSGASLADQLVPSLEYTWKKEWSVSVSWPWIFQYIVEDSGKDQARWHSGSPDLGVEWQAHANGGRKSLGLGWNPAVDSDQLHRFSFLGQTSMIVDPVVLGASVRLGTSIPREISGTTWWQPFDFSLGLSLTEVLNSHIGWTLGLSPSVSAPWAVWPVSRRIFPLFGLGLSIQVFYDQTTWNTKSGWNFDGSQTQWTGGAQWVPELSSR